MDQDEKPMIGWRRVSWAGFAGGVPRHRNPLGMEVASQTREELKRGAAGRVDDRSPRVFSMLSRDSA